MPLAKTVILPTTPNRLPESIGQSLIERLRHEFEINAWAFVMPDHLLDALYNGFKNDPNVAKADLISHLPAHVKEALYPAPKPVTPVVPAASVIVEGRKSSGRGCLRMDASEDNLKAKKSQPLRIKEVEKEVVRHHIPLAFPVQRHGQKQSRGISL